MALGEKSPELLANLESLAKNLPETWAAYGPDDAVELEKNLKAIAAALGMGLSSLGSASEPKATPSANHIELKTDTLHPEMHAIAFLESSYGKNQNHAPHALGDWHTAKGPLGFKPSSAYEEFSKSKHLQALHPDIQTKEQFAEKFKDPDFYNLVSASHWSRLKRHTGSATGAALAWRYGRTGHDNMSEEGRKTDSYAKRYQKLQETKPWATKLTDTSKKLTEPVQKSLLYKAMEYPGFPKIADPKQAGEVKVVNTPQELKEAQSKLGIQNDNQAYGGTKPKADFAYVKGSALSPGRTRIERDPNLATSHQAHEKLHLYMNQVERLHGREARLNLAENLYHSVPEDSRKELDVFTRRRFPKGAEEGFPMWHEERIAGLLNYMNSDSEKAAEFSHRNKWAPQSRAAHLVIQHSQGTPAQEVEQWDLNKQRNFHQKVSEFKDLHQKLYVAFLALQRASKQADHSWLKRKPKETIKKSESFDLNDQELETLEALTSVFDSCGEEFKTASFMANNYTPSLDDIHRAMLSYESDVVGAALDAHKLPVTDENREMLQILLRAKSGDKLGKSEGLSQEVLEFKPFDKGAVSFATKAQEAYKAGKIKRVKLGGKHSAGSRLLRDSEGQVWFLKPGSGGLSSAKGVTEEKASASRREVAFNQVSVLCGMQNFVPKSALLVVNGQETAMMQFFTGTYRPTNKIRKEGRLDSLFAPYIENTVLHRCATLDYLMGNTDRHAGNVLSDGKDFRLIDAGSAFAGDSFNPLDPKTFIPIYLRAFSSRDFKVMTPKERFDLMPKLNEKAELSFVGWLQSLPMGQILHLLHRYGINSEPFVRRYNELMGCSGPKSEFLNKFWAGMAIEGHSVPVGQLV